MATRSALSDDGSGEAADDECYSSSTSSSNADFTSYTTTSLDDALSFMNDVQLELRLPSEEPPMQENRVSSSHSTQEQQQQSSTTQPKKRQKRPRTSHTVKPSTQRFVRKKTNQQQVRTEHTDLSELRRAELSSASSHSGSHEPSSATAQTACPPQQQQQEQEQELSDACSALHANAAMWLNQAAQQYEQLQQTETAHDRLRATLAKQVELAKLLDNQVQAQSALLSQCPSYTDRALKLQNCSRARTQAHARAPPRVSPGCPWIRTEQLHKCLPVVYRDIDLEQFGSPRDVATTIFSSSRTKCDAVRGPVFELKSSAPVPSSVADLSAVLWEILGGSDDDNERDGIEVMDERDIAQQSTEPSSKLDGSTEKWYSLKLQTQYGDVDVHGASVLGRHVEPQRVAFTFASSVAVAESDLVFGETGWFVLTTAEPTLPSTSSLFQTFYQLQVQHPASSSDSESLPLDPSSECAYLQELVMNALGNRMRVQHQRIQNLLLQDKAQRMVTPASSSKASGWLHMSANLN